MHPSPPPTNTLHSSQGRPRLTAEAASELDVNSEDCLRLELNPGLDSLVLKSRSATYIQPRESGGGIPDHSRREGRSGQTGKAGRPFPVSRNAGLAVGQRQQACGPVTLRRPLSHNNIIITEILISRKSQ